MDSKAIEGFVGKLWDEQIVPQLVDYIRIPNKSPMFDKDWAAHGYMDAAVALMETWARAQTVAELLTHYWKASAATYEARAGGRSAWETED